MKLHPLAAFIALVFAIAAGFLPAGVRAQEATQTLQLANGWNAVWLEVEPRNTDGGLKTPTQVFGAIPAIQTVASPKPLFGLSEVFASSPASAPLAFNQDGWEQWQNPVVTANTLSVITGNRGYLIKTNAAVSVPLTGRVRFHRHPWIPDRYNLVGFGLAATPTFEAFFGPSGTTHPRNKIFTLDASTGNWATVNAGSAMTNGKAYWVFCSGPSSYMGPVAVDFDGAAGGKLNFHGPDDAVTVGEGVDETQLDLEDLVFTNLSTTVAAPELDLVNDETTNPGITNALELYVVRPSAVDIGWIQGPRVDSSPAAGGSPSLGKSVSTLSNAALTLGARRVWNSGLVGRTNVYRLMPGGGAAFWLPVSAVNTSLSPATDLTPSTPAGVAKGLWVGDVIVSGSSSIVEDGAPVRPAAAAAPLRIILHSDAGGAVRLLSQVILMQTRSADPAVPPAPVLVVDPARIPFFEGILERDGKKAGMRIATTSFDMPRKIDATSQAALLADPAYPGLSAAGIADFLVSRSLRPPSLAEVYHFTWAMDGALGTGRTTRTSASSPLNLDPFHRTNPYRHAFHQQHPRGPLIRRDIEIVFSSTASVPGRLSGTYREVLKGVVKSDLVLTGTIDLRRVSSAGTLEGAP